MLKFIRFLDLNGSQIETYRQAIRDGFPDILSESEGMSEYWRQLEKISPRTQIFLVDDKDALLGFMNTIPVQWNGALTELPEEGWDWLAQKGLLDFREGRPTNCLGGLQIIVTKANLGKGYSKLLIQEAKRLVSEMEYDHFFIPIRPTFKYKHPRISMEDYLVLKENGKIYDPWIRTHLNSGARIIKICHQAMTISGDIPYWEVLLGERIISSGEYDIDGALNPVIINLEENQGVYYEPNIWIAYR